MSISPGATGEGRTLMKRSLMLEQPEQVDEVALEEAPRAQVAELAAREAQLAERRNLALDLADVGRQVDARRAALEAVFDLGPREVMQHDLHHRELVEVGVEQRLDDHARWREGGRRGCHVTRRCRARPASAGAGTGLRGVCPDEARRGQAPSSACSACRRPPPASPESRACRGPARATPAGG